MFHLLLDEDKKQLKTEYRQRVAFVALTALFLVIIVSSLLLLPSEVLTRSKEKIVVQKAEQMKATRDPEEDKKIAAQFDAYKQKLALLEPVAAVDISHVVSVLRKTAGDRVTLTGYFYTQNEGEPFTLTLNGIAKDRQGLVSFSRALEHEGLFSKIDFPVSDLADDHDISFSVQLTGK